ncbi:hypothetical protein B0A48_00934 [Cryoendolithus antarcticus]|uniref:Uncharacterized protein n=1 Tax=Cryoendolithus antarcticus TaxID=1507870 RepID=A0A1V8TRX2_9PEZI|nr:hypothetical protein B0A48_00934 [Cryoendolithus antarcticus]
MPDLANSRIILSTDPLVWMDSEPNPPLTLADMERIRQVGPPAPHGGFQPRIVALDEIPTTMSGYVPAFKPMLVIWPDGSARAVRPAPPYRPIYYDPRTGRSTFKPFSDERPKL